MTLGIGTFTVSSSGQDTFYFSGHPRYDAVRVDFNSANSTGNDVDVDIRGYNDNDPRQAEADGDYSNMDELASTDAVDASSGDPSFGTEAATRTMAVRVDETSGVGDVEVTVVRHNADDPAENGAAFANR